MFFLLTAKVKERLNQPLPYTPTPLKYWWLKEDPYCCKSTAAIVQLFYMYSM